MNFFTKTWRRLQWARTPEKKKRQMMEETVDLLKLDPDAYELLRMARADGVEIRFSSELTGSTTSARHILNFGIQKQYIEICPYTASGELKTPGKTAPDLVHELRHYWQYKQLGVTPQNGNHLNRTPRLAFIFNRVAEADAYAFQDKFVDTVNETFKGVDEMTKILLEFQEKKGLLTPEDVFLFSQKINMDFQQFRSKDGQLLKTNFMDRLKSKNLSDSYDPREVRHLHLFHTSPAARSSDFAAVKNIPELTLADIKGVLKAGVMKNAPGYLDEMSDDQFENLVLGHAHKKALEAVSLMEKFRGAVADNDNKTAKALRRQVQEKIRKL